MYKSVLYKNNNSISKSQIILSFISVLNFLYSYQEFDMCIDIVYVLWIDFFLKIDKVLKGGDAQRGKINLKKNNRTVSVGSEVIEKKRFFT